jgi:tetratricopeptide (TPR) repeat protein
MNTTASEGGGPYVGRRAFTLVDHNVFFGRDREIEDLSALWRSGPFVVLHGPAGSGKTSLLQAGVAPVLAAYGEVLPLGRPLGASLFPEPLLDEHNPYSLAVLASWSPGESRARLAQQSVTDFLRHRAHNVRRLRADSLLVVAIDQVEDILVDERAVQAKEEFFADLAVAIREVPGLRVLLAARTDALSKLLTYEKQLSPAGVVRFGLTALTDRAAVDAVRRPMETAGNRFGGGAAEYIVGTLGSSPPGALAEGPAVQPTQLQVVCAELWRVIRAPGTLITHGFVRDNIDVGQILASFCASVISEVGDRYSIAADRIFGWLMQAFLPSDVDSDPDPVKMSEAQLTAIGLPVGVLRVLESEHLLAAEWSLDTKKYRLVNDQLVIGMRYLAKSPVFDHPKLDTAARMRVAELALASGELDLALRHVAEALDAVNPAEARLRADALSLLGNIEYQVGQPDRAEENYRDAAKWREQLGDQPEVGRLFGAIGCIHSRQGQYLRAVDELQAAVTRAPSDLLLKNKLATAFWHAGQSQAAAALFSAVLSIEPESADALAGRGQITAERGNAGAALVDLQALRRLRPSVGQQPEVQLAYALALAAKGMSETALAEVDAALSSASDSAAIFISAARVALASGAVNRAHDLLTQAEQARHPALSSSQRAQVHRLMAEAGKSGSGAAPHGG